jgi:putative nucleotidyltransferase with HDIG domain
MIEAPGTYHHSVVVGTLVEAAASEIGANPLLAKVCGYYHDIGKIKKPLYFIENQKGKNRHDKLAPSMSSLILIAHVRDGVEIAKKNKLGQVIIDTIKQHHGTSLIKYFYEKAKQRKGEDFANMDDFRYPGPKPQTREAGLVMLADAVEAASRTLDNPTPSRIQGLVQNLINTIFSDGQLDACELTLKDLHNIAKSFNKILTGIHHHRIDYPEQRAAVNGNGKGKIKNGSPDRQQAKQTRGIIEEDTKDGSRRLKRLGLS